MTEKIELLPCTCGRMPNFRFDTDRIAYYVECLNCDVHIYGFTPDIGTEKEAWNKFITSLQPKWQPMDTAPRDGTEVLLIKKWGRVTDARYLKEGGWFDGNKFILEMHLAGWMRKPPLQEKQETP